MNVSDFELKVLRRIERGYLMGGDRMVAISAAARRLEKKELAGKGRNWYVTKVGREFLTAVEQGAAHRPPQQRSLEHECSGGGG